MSRVTYSEVHAPYQYMGILGCSGYDPNGKIICLTANGDNHYLKDGIVEGSLLFVDTEKQFCRGALNVFRLTTETEPQYKLARNKPRNATYVGKVLMAINQFQTPA